MARLSKEDFVKSITTIIGDRTDEDSVKFIENMTDTYNGLEADKNVTDKEWEQKYNALDHAWSTRYRERFSETITEDKKDDKTMPTNYNDLFT